MGLHLKNCRIWLIPQYTLLIFTLYCTSHALGLGIYVIVIQYPFSSSPDRKANGKNFLLHKPGEVMQVSSSFFPQAWFGFAGWLASRLSSRTSRARAKSHLNLFSLKRLIGWSVCMGANKIFACSSCVYEMAKSGERLWKTAREVYWEGKKERQQQRGALAGGAQWNGKIARAQKALVTG